MTLLDVDRALGPTAERIPRRRLPGACLSYDTKMRAATAAGLLVASVVYFGSFWNYGFEPGDVGNYALMSYELARGATPADLALGYGPLWYFLGAVIFRFTDLGYPGIMLILYACAFLTALLTYLVILECTRRQALALGAALICILVPPFPASVSRPFCVALAVFLLMRLAIRIDKAGPADFVLPALGTAFCWMVRPEVGYLIGGALAVVLGLWCLGRRAPLADRLATGLRAGLVLVGTTCVAVLPLALDALRRGYVDAVAGNLLSYPGRLAAVLLSFGRAPAAPGATAEAGAYLQPLPLEALVGADPFQRAFAVLTYTAALVLTGYTLYVGVRIVRRPGDLHGHAVPFVVLVAGLSQFPTFLFRPDWAHFGTFALSYLIVVSYALYLLLTWRPGGTRARAASWWVAHIAILALWAQVVFLVATGLQAPGVGYLAQVANRSVTFTGEHHLQVVVAPAERQALEHIAALIRVNTVPDERIVCLPYCPGYPFMAGRRLLFKHYYVDDAFLVHTPNWIADAIQLTEAEQPPIVIVLDWAVNGTEISRFRNWARLYMDYVQAHYPYEVPITGGSAFLARAPAGVTAPTPEAMRVTAFGPASTRVGVPFGVQPDGSSAMWFQVASSRSTWVVVFNGQRLPTTVAPTLLTAAVPAAQLARPGRYEVYLLDTASGVRSDPVYFDVTAE